MWLKERFGVRKFRVRGLLKARAELLWATLAYSVAQWVRLVCREPLAARGGGLEGAENGPQGVRRHDATVSHGSQPDSISPRRRIESDNRRRAGSLPLRPAALSDLVVLQQR